MELERNEFQLRIRWNGTEWVSVQSWMEWNATSSKKIGMEYNTVCFYSSVVSSGKIKWGWFICYIELDCLIRLSDIESSEYLVWLKVIADLQYRCQFPRIQGCTGPRHSKRTFHWYWSRPVSIRHKSVPFECLSYSAPISPQQAKGRYPKFGCLSNSRGKRCLS